MISERDLDILRTVVVPSLKQNCAIGLSWPVEGVLLARRQQAHSSGCADIIAAFEDAERWLAGTKEMESVNGKDCRLDKAHPAYVEANDFWNKRLT